ncbi:hypothetical protein THRCLA_08290 [Thraustotheca clavata]|uniref:BTB domain-containing protein n=1 Tax=Thraustotheca clavata TaxID=74557 RepID=A0A1V9Z7M2_9STRA|nr:hypothetical protein THRCLA_08290 [Thraustotheca clavata]
MSSALQKEHLKRSLSGSLDMLKLFSADFLETSQSIQNQLEELERKEKQWQDLEMRLQLNAKSAANIITLDVGGTIFRTSKETLLRLDGTYFQAMLGSGCWQPDTDTGAYFIDIDPIHFDRVMVYLRTGELSFDGLNDWEIRHLKSTLDYLNITTPRDTHESIIPQEMTWNPHICSSGLTLLDNNKAVQRSKSPGRSVSHSVLGSASVEVFTVRIESITTVGNVLGKIFLGLSPIKGFGVYSYNPEVAGYYVELRHGTLYAQDGIRGQSYCAAFTEGDLITVRWRRQLNEIHFEKNDQELGIAFSNVPKEIDLFPAVGMYYHGAHISFV